MSNMNLTEKVNVLGPEQEATYLLDLYDGRLAPCVEFVRHHFTVIQARSQLLLTICTLALTITGFSGPRIAETNAFARYSMICGIVFVLLTMLLLILGGLRLRWITQMAGKTPLATLTGILVYRNRKVRLYLMEVIFLAIGLSTYVASVVTFLLFGVA